MGEERHASATAQPSSAGLFFFSFLSAIVSQSYWDETQNRFQTHFGDLSIQASFSFHCIRIVASLGESEYIQ